MATLAQQRCLNHGQREAVARCPECRKFFCRECVTEHHGRMICQPCLHALVESAPTGGSRSWAVLGRGLGVVVGFLVAWWVFYLVGSAMIAIPSEFHDGTAFSDF